MANLLFAISYFFRYGDLCLEYEQGKHVEESALEAFDSKETCWV
jgi:hypothetical protein